MARKLTIKQTNEIAKEYYNRIVEKIHHLTRYSVVFEERKNRNDVAAVTIFPKELDDFCITSVVFFNIEEILQDARNTGCAAFGVDQSGITTGIKNAPYIQILVD